MQDKVANKVAGMVDVVARIVADDEVRTFNFKSNEVIFGGGRLRVNAKDIPLDVNALFAVYDEANANAASGKAKADPAPSTGNTSKGRSSRSRKKEEATATGADKPQDSPKEEQTVNNTPEPENGQEAPKRAQRNSLKTMLTSSGIFRQRKGKEARLKVL